MPWFRVDDNFHQHPKVKKAGNAAVGLWIRCGSWSSNYLTDGCIASDVVHDYGTAREVERLLEAGLWTINGAGFVIPDYLDYNPSAAQVRAERAAARARQAKRRRNEGNGQYE